MIHPERQVYQLVALLRICGFEENNQTGKRCKCYLLNKIQVNQDWS